MFSNGERHDPFAALRLRDFRFHAVGGIFATIGQQMQAVAVGWELYQRTDSALALGWVGLIQALPIIVLALPAGQLADRYNRKRMVMVAQLMMTTCSLSLGLVSYLQGPVNLFYLILFANAVARAFMAPARAALMPQIVPAKLFANAVTWNTSVFQISSVMGPALGGLLIALSQAATPIYFIDASFGLMRLLLTALIRLKAVARNAEPITLRSLSAGIDFVWRTKAILATITLDMFAVLLGGATTLLPIFAKDILAVGPTGLGWLRAAPSLGALVMGFLLVYLPPLKSPGKALLWAVAGFGIATVVFGLSRSYWLSLLALATAGALDNISVVVRHTLVQTLTPDEMRGRVSAVNNIFITSSNELGGFESGLVAALWGPIFSVVSGGIGTILVVVAVMTVWPQVRRIGALER